MYKMKFYAISPDDIYDEQEFCSDDVFELFEKIVKDINNILRINGEKEIELITKKSKLKKELDYVKNALFFVLVNVESTPYDKYVKYLYTIEPEIGDGNDDV